MAKAFGVPLDTDPRALAILHKWVKTTGAEINEARLRMTRLPKGADLIVNKVSGAPGFWIGNVIVMAGVPSIMQAMPDEVAPKLKTGVRMLSETIARMRARATLACSLARSRRPIRRLRIGGYPFFDPQNGPNMNVVLRARDPQKLAFAKRAVEDMLERVRRHKFALSRRKQGFESPRERQRFQSFSPDNSKGFGEFLGSKRCGTLADASEHKVAAYRRCQFAQTRSRASGSSNAAQPSNRV